MDNQHYKRSRIQCIHPVGSQPNSYCKPGVEAHVSNPDRKVRFLACDGALEVF